MIIQTKKHNLSIYIASCMYLYSNMICTAVAVVVGLGMILYGTYHDGLIENWFVNLLKHLTI